MSVNSAAVSWEYFESLRAKFDISIRHKLDLYTGEELYYVYKICTFVPKKTKAGDIKSGDVTYLMLKNKMLRYLRGEEKHPIYPSAFDKLGKKFKFQFETEAEFVPDDNLIK